MAPIDASITEHDLTGEDWREYVWSCDRDTEHVHRINKPAKLFLKKYPDGRPGTTHRVLDADGIVHIVPAIGLLGCVVRCKPKDAASPVRF